MIASRGKINLDWLKVKISLHLQCTRENTPDVQDHLTELQKCSNPGQVVTFLINKNFLGYLNFYLLKPFKEVISNEGFGKKCQDYQSKHNLFVKNKFLQKETSQSLSTVNNEPVATRGGKKIQDIGFLNMWDTSLHNKTIRPILESFDGCFTRSNLWYS